MKMRSTKKPKKTISLAVFEDILNDLAVMGVFLRMGCFECVAVFYYNVYEYIYMQIEYNHEQVTNIKWGV